MKIIIRYLAALFVLFALISFSGCSGEENNKSNTAVTYYCPMHPEVTSDKPGVCPICHMDLVRKDAGGDDMAKHLDEGLSLSATKVVLANVTVVPVRKGEISSAVSAYSYLDFSEEGRKFISAKFNGRIEKLFVDKSGAYIKQGQPLFEVYSPELVQAQNEYMLAIKSGSLNFSDMREASRQKLKLMGITDAQLKELESGKIQNSEIVYYSPHNGTVIDKKVQEGMYINEGTILYETADLSTLWNIAEVYEAELGTIKKGGKVKLSLDAYPGETFEGFIDLVYPVLNSQSRTVKVRSIVPNRDGKLRPNMYGRTIFESKGGTGLLIPEEAVLKTGSKNVVWVQREKGIFEHREVSIGRRINGEYEVMDGLKEGELVAASGGFLIDSESQLRGGTSEIHDHPEDPVIKNNKNSNGDENHSSENK